MAEVPVPFTDEDVDTDDGTGAVVTIGLLIAGFSVFSLAQATGGAVAQHASDTIAQYTGFNPATGESAEADLV